MKKQMEMIQRVLLDKYLARRASMFSHKEQERQKKWRDAETIGLDIIGAIGMTGYLVLVIGHCI